MNNIPLSDACFSEVLARVAFRWIHLCAKKPTELELTPKAHIARATLWAEDAKLETLAFWCMAYGQAWLPLYQTKATRDGFILRARQGKTWRAVAFPQYKSHRRDPRVTNRGVARDDVIGEL